MSRQSWQAIGEAGFARSERVSAELLALTYVEIEIEERALRPTTPSAPALISRNDS